MAHLCAYPAVILESVITLSSYCWWISFYIIMTYNIVPPRSPLWGMCSASNYTRPWVYLMQRLSLCYITYDLFSRKRLAVGTD